MISVNPVILSNFSSFFCAFLWLKNPRNLRNPWLINDLRAFGIFTLVKMSLQISPFCSNKPNFRKSQMNVNKVLIKAYEQLDTWSIGKNKPNTNPIQSQSKPKQTQFKPKQTQFQDPAPTSRKNKTVAGTKRVIRAPIQRQRHSPAQSDTASTPRPPA